MLNSKFLIAIAAVCSLRAFAEEAPFPVVNAEPPVVDASSRHWLISPQIVISVPQPLQVGVEVLRTENQNFRAFASLGYLRYPFTGGEKNLKLFSAQLGVRYSPFRNWFFGALSLGYRNISFSTDVSSFKMDDEILATNGTIGLTTLFTGLSLGGDFALSKKLSLGFDLGAQIALTGSGGMFLSNSTNGSDSSNSALLSTGSDSAALDRLSRLLIPQITLARLTWHLD